MRPLALEFEGFTAFRERQQISFEELSLFTITGPTGAGKTSILDAMIFALYGQVPRAGSHTVRELVSQGLTEARVTFSFEIGQSSFRVARRLPRKGAQRATVERREGEDWVSELDGGGVTAANKRIEEIVRLDFDTFTRAVVLPQGQFQRFLSGNSAERRKILVELLGLSSYEAMGAIARGEADRIKQAVASVEEVLEKQYAGVDEDALKQLQERKDEAERSSLQLRDALATAEGLDSQRASADDAIADLNDISSRVQASADELLALDVEIDGAAKDEQQAREAAEQASAEIKAHEVTLATARSGLTTAVESYGDLTAITRAENALENLATCEQQRSQQQSQLEQTREVLKQVSRQQSERAQQLKKAQASTKTAETVTAAARAAAEKARNEATEHQQRFTQAEAADSERDSKRATLKAAAISSETAANALDNARTAHETAERARAEAEAADHVAALLVGVEPGDPCPVCQRPLDEHPKAAGNAAALAKAREREVKARTALGEAEGAAADATARREGAETQLAECEQRIATLLASYKDLNALKDAAAKAEANAQKLSQAVQAAEETENQAREAERAALEQSADTTAARNAAEIQIQTAEHAIAEAEKQIAKHTDVLDKHFKGANPSDRAAALTDQRSTLEQAQAAVQAAEQPLTAARQLGDAAEQRLREASRRVSKAEQQLTKLVERCDSQLERARPPCEEFGIDHLPPAAELESNIAAAPRLKAWCEAMNGTLASALKAGGKRVASLERELVKIVRGCGLEPGNSEVTNQVRDAARAADEQRGRVIAQTEGMEKRLQERRELAADIESQQHRQQIYAMLGKELQANNFINFIIEETLQVLAVRASEELLRLSDDRYELATTEGDFCVVDHVNADETRSVATLSGGETFLASLALALALSQHIGELRSEGIGARLDAVFIDEGFGSLDPQTLEDVVNGLERLREAELTVGVITHVAAMADRINVGLVVERTMGRSRVRIA